MWFSGAVLYPLLLLIWVQVAGHQPKHPSPTSSSNSSRRTPKHSQHTRDVIFPACPGSTPGASQTTWTVRDLWRPLKCLLHVKFEYVRLFFPVSFDRCFPVNYPAECPLWERLCLSIHVCSLLPAFDSVCPLSCWRLFAQAASAVSLYSLNPCFSIRERDGRTSALTRPLQVWREETAL